VQSSQRWLLSPLAVIAGGIGAYAVLAIGYNCFVEPAAKGHAAVNKAIPEMVVDHMAPPAVPSAIIPSQGQALLPVAPEAAAAAPPTETSAAEEPKRLPSQGQALLPVAPEASAATPPTETSAAEKPKRHSKKQAVRNRVQRNPLELALRSFGGLRLPF
jgi:hypothetical protein